MSGTIHTFADNSYGIGHNTQGECPCKPKRNVQIKPRLSGKYGKHYGHTTKTTIAHNALPVAVN